MKKDFGDNPESSSQVFDFSLDSVEFPVDLEFVSGVGVFLVFCAGHFDLILNPPPAPLNRRRGGRKGGTLGIGSLGFVALRGFRRALGRERRASRWNFRVRWLDHA